ncbi:RICIN domain-containing protein [Kitasatospora sp. NPDC006697]|uniref:RICIN domain-containing protein n=1 Tax=Kitasatospora sp. NPDC006697 TaxID=3364020 RepID=UPI00367C47FD
MRINRLALALLAGTSVLALAATAQAVPHSDGPAAAAPMAGPAANKQVVDVSSPDQIPTTGSRASTAPAGADQPGITYRTTAFTNNHGGKCLDGDLNTIGNNGAIVQLWDCNGWDNQTWYWTPVEGQSGVYTLQNGHGLQCLDGDLNTIGNNGAKVQLWGCNGWDNQSWAWDGTTLKNTHGGKCLDGDLNTIGNNGAIVQLWDCNGWDNQSWTYH